MSRLKAWLQGASGLIEIGGKGQALKAETDLF